MVVYFSRKCFGLSITWHELSFSCIPLLQQQFGFSTRQGLLNGSNDAIVFYHKSCPQNIHLVLNPFLLVFHVFFLRLHLCLTIGLSPYDLFFFLEFLMVFYSHNQITWDEILPFFVYRYYPCFLSNIAFIRDLIVYVYSFIGSFVILFGNYEV